jgi:hypothetical protein
VDSNHCLPGQSRRSWPLNDPAVAGSGRIERPKLASKTSGLPLTELPVRHLVGPAGIEPAWKDPQSFDLPLIYGPHTGSAGGLATGDFSHVMPLEPALLKLLVDLRGIEPRSARCKRAVLPLNERPMVAAPGVEPGNVLAYETELVPTSPQQNSSRRLLRHGAGAENRTPLTGLAVRCPTNRPHPRNLITLLVMRIQLSKTKPRHSSSASLPTGSKLDRELQTIAK